MMFLPGMFYRCEQINYHWDNLSLKDMPLTIGKYLLNLFEIYWKVMDPEISIYLPYIEYLFREKESNIVGH